MSLLKANAVQLGQSITATNNFVLYQPASPDGTVRLGNGNSGSVTDLITVGTTGNLTFANSVSLSAASTRTLTLNGGAGSNGLVLDASNNVGIGTSSPGYKLDVIGGEVRTLLSAGQRGGLQQFVYSSTNSYDAPRIQTWRARGTSASPSVVVTGDELWSWQGSAYNASSGWTYAGGIFLYATGAISGTTVPSYLSFQTNNGGAASEKMLLDSSGNLGLGVTPSSWDFGGNLVLPGAGSYISAKNINLTLAANLSYSGGAEKYVASNPATKYLQGSGTHTWYNAPSGTAGNAITFTQAMTLDASGNLGVGQTSVVNRLDVLSSGSYSAVVDMTTAQLRLKHSTFPVQLYAGLDHVNRFAYMQASETGVGYRDLSLQPAGGALIVGTTNTLGNCKVNVLFTNGTTNGLSLYDTASSGTANMVLFYRGGSQVGSITSTSGTTAFNPTSDISLKENIKPITNGLERVAKLKPVDYNWKSDGVLDNGFIAQDLLATEEFAHRCNAIETKEDGTKVYGVDYMKFVAVLTAAIQELSAELNELKQRIK